MNQFENYKVKERVGILLETLTIKQALATYEAELNSFENMWSGYSCDSLGHGITFNRLAIDYLKIMLN